MSLTDRLLPVSLPALLTIATWSPAAEQEVETAYSGADFALQRLLARHPAPQPRDGRYSREAEVPQIGAGLDPLVELSWPQLKQHATATSHDGLMELLAINRAGRPLQARFEFYPNGARERVELPTIEALMEPGERVILPVDLKQLGFDLDRLRSAASLRVLVQAEEQSGGKRLDHSFSPTIYFHQQRRGAQKGRLWVYDELVMRRWANGAPHQNPACTLTLGTLPSPTPERPGPGLTRLALQMDIDPGDGDPQPDHANTVLTGAPPQPSQIKFCFAIPVDTEDSFIGHDFATKPVSYFNGSYVRATVRTLPPQAQTLVEDVVADEEGCITIDHVANNGYRVSIAALAEVPRTDDSNETNALQVRTGPPFNAVGGWSWCTEADIAAGTTRWLYLNPGRLANLLGLSIWSLRRFSDGIGGNTIIVYDRPCASNNKNSCNTTGGHLEVNPLHNKFRYALSHEMGHAVFHRFNNGTHPMRQGAYNVDAGGDACEWDQGAHGLHSKEFSVSAITEGFAQFYATAVWNRLDQQQAWFHYYKEDYKANAPDGPVTVVDMEFDTQGGVTAYLENMCAGPLDGFGVELDWARQFWDYMTNTGDKPTKLQLMQQLQLAYNDNFINPSWSLGTSNERMAGAVEKFFFDTGIDFQERWNDFAVANGVPGTSTASCNWSGAWCSWSDCPCTATSCPESNCAP